MSFTIDFTEINKVINLLENCKSIHYDVNNKVYTIDNKDEIEEKFFLEVCSKFSHFINVINNTLLYKKTVIQLEKSQDNVIYKPKKGAKNAKKE